MPETQIPASTESTVREQYVNGERWRMLTIKRQASPAWARVRTTTAIKTHRRSVSRHTRLTRYE